MAPADPDNKPADIITYVGVPLTVLGLVPIIYNFLSTLLTLFKIKRKLRLNNVEFKTTRSDIVNRVIEVEFPRYAVTPKSRLAPVSTQLSAQRSKLDGGSWTTFEWEKREVGIKIQRIQYPSQLRQPQVDVDFGELVSYLHSLGAIPDRKGWKRLRSSGLWTPKGLSLMNSPDGSQKALVVASLDDSDGNLSLSATVDWSPAWVPERSSFQPPDVVRLPSPTAKGPVVTAGSAIEAPGCSKKTAGSSSSKDLREQSGDSPEKSLGASKRNANASSDGSVVCHLSSCGLSEAHVLTSSPLAPAATHDVQNIEHLRVRDGSTEGVWFASAATAYGATTKTILWSYTIPSDILSFARNATVPCGVLVLLGIASNSETPEWATRRSAHDDQGGLYLDRLAEKRLAAQAEARMSPEQRRATSSERKRTEQRQRLRDLHDQVRLEDQSRATRTNEALQSPRWDAARVAEHSLRWLKSHNHLGGSTSVEGTAGPILRRMVLDAEFSSSICGVLDAWKAWVDNEGMRGSDLAALQEAPEMFAQASLLVALVKVAATGSQQVLADLQACVRTWKTVRFG